MISKLFIIKKYINSYLNFILSLNEHDWVCKVSQLSFDSISSLVMSFDMIIVITQRVIASSSCSWTFIVISIFISYVKVKQKTELFAFFLRKQS